MRILCAIIVGSLLAPLAHSEIPGESRQRVRNSAPEVAQYIQGMGTTQVELLFINNKFRIDAVGFDDSKKTLYSGVLDDLKKMITTTCEGSVKVCFNETQLAAYLSSQSDASTQPPESSVPLAQAAQKILAQIQLYTESDSASVAKFLSTIDPGKTDFLFYQMFGDGFVDSDGVYSQAFADLRLMVSTACADGNTACFDSSMLQAYLANEPVPPKTSSDQAKAALQILGKVAKDLKPDTPRAGFVKLDNEQQGSINWLKYYLAFSDEVWIPIYLVSATASAKKDTDALESDLLNRNGGVLNFKYASERAVYPFGLCNFNISLRGGCYVVWEAGAKVLSIDDAEGDADYEYAAYASAGMDFEFPIFPDMANKPSADKPFNIDPAGNLLIGASVNTLHTSTDKIREFYLINGETAKLNIEETTSYVDWRIGFQITGKISIEAGGIAWSDSDTLKENNYVRVGYNHLLDF